MSKDLFFVLWFFLPAGIANAAPVFTAKLPLLRNVSAPMDNGYSFRGIRLLGPNKTWRGFVSGVSAATLTFWLQQLAVNHSLWLQALIHPVDYSHLPALLVGPLLGIGALCGDSIESFFKRQQGRPPGHGWFPFDQTDYIIGAAIAIAPITRLTLLQYLWIVVVWLLIHLAATFSGYLLDIRGRPT